MALNRYPIRIYTRSRTPELKAAVVASFALESSAARIRLGGFGDADWRSILRWLDISGLAIYFYHRTGEIDANSSLPRDVNAGLAHRLENNRGRINSLIEESRVLAGWFETGGVFYALLKGITLTPHSVQESVLRCQTDLDFLVAERFANLAIHYIHRLGYRLHAQSGSTLEFRAGASSLPSLSNLYSVNTQRALELHLVKEDSSECRLLQRRTTRDFGGVGIYVLSPADILVEQARHLLKHLCGEHTRVSWVLEFWRHVNSRRGDSEFWRHTEICATQLTHGDLAMGVAVWVAEELFGGAQAEVPQQWRSDALPVRVRLWLERYARRLLLSDTIGTKLYAFLREELPPGILPLRTTRQILLPRVLPAAVFDVPPNESWSRRWARYRAEARQILWRLWFHLREGIRFAIEVPRWYRTAARTGR